MALDPTLNTYAVAVAVASGVVAAGMHATSLAGSDQPWPLRRKLISELIRAAVVGIAACEVMRAVPWQVQLVPLLVVAALTGGYLGPRGIGWLFLSVVAVVRKVVPLLSAVPDPPAPPEVKPPELSGTPEEEVQKDA